MENQDYQKLRNEISNPYSLLANYAYISKNISNSDFDKYFQPWCRSVTGLLPIETCMSMIINYLDTKHGYTNK